jgi:chromosomal replication initiation ATPase DnaA
MKAASGRLAPDVLLAHMAQIAEASGYTLIDICGRGQQGELPRVRRVVARYLRARGCSYSEIGKLLGGRDHTTVMVLVKGSRTRKRGASA